MMLGQHRGDWDQWVMRLLGRAVGETVSGVCLRHEEQVVEKWAEMVPNTQGQLALSICISTFQRNPSAATE